MSYDYELHKWTNAHWAPTLSMTLSVEIYKLSSDILEKNHKQPVLIEEYSRKGAKKGSQ